MSVFQIIAICVLGAGCLTAIGFTIAFVVESLRKARPEKEEIAQDEEVSEINLEEMLARLEEASAKKEEKKEEVQEEIQELEEEQPVEETQEVEVKEEEPEAPVVEIVEELKEETETVEVVEEAKEEVEETETIEESKEEVEETEEVEAPVVVVVDQVEEKSAPEFDYRVRLQKIKESQSRIDKDLEKTTRAILKYERTIRRKERNQKMLDRRALELTNLNLLMYSVTDIKNVDAEKKARQEELTAHIAELKASIQDAESYIEANKEKHENNIKLRDYLAHEKKRYADEVKELETLIASGKYFDDNAEGSDGENNN